MATTISNFKRTCGFFKSFIIFPNFIYIYINYIKYCQNNY